MSPQLLSVLREDFKALRMGLETILGEEREDTDQTRRMQEVTEIMLKTDPAVGLVDFEVCNKFDSRERLSQIRKPTLIVGGSEDVVTPPWYQHYLHEKLENSTLRIMEGVGHYSMFENPEGFNAILSKFLERHL